MSPREAGARTAQGPPQQLPGGPDTISGTVTDTSTPQLPGDGPGGGGSDPNDPSAGTPLSNPIQQGPMGLNPNQVTTKPRQMPGGGGGLDQGMPPMPGAGGGPMDFDPAMNGSDQASMQPQPGQTPDAGESPESVPQNTQAVRRVARVIWEANPSLSAKLVRRLAVRAVSRYLKEAATAPQRPEGTGEPRTPQRPAEPKGRASDEAMGRTFDPDQPQQPWYQHNGDPQDLANRPVPAENSLWQDRR